MAPEPERQTPAFNSDEFKATDPWSHDEPPRWNDAAAPLAAEDDDPVLVVEDDDPSPKAPVRREEYRNLFSRLRGD
jgi:hypothetical protein